MALLLYTNKIESIGPSSTTSFRIESFQVDSYRIRAATGFNNAEVKYNITWVDLTQAEAAALVAQFNASRGVHLLQWTPPLEAEELNFTVESYSSGLHVKQAPYTYTITASLMKEYDIA